MQNRNAKKPGRVLITPENGSPAFYATMKMADEPIEEGTAFNKENILSDGTGFFLGLLSPETATPNDAFFALRKAVALKDGTFKTMDGQDGSAFIIKNVKGTGVFPVRYELPFVPRFAIVRGWAKGGKTAVSLVYPGSGGTVTQVDKSGLVVNYQMKIDGAGILISSSPGGEIAGAHNQRGSFESIIAFR